MTEAQYNFWSAAVGAFLLVLFLSGLVAIGVWGVQKHAEIEQCQRSITCQLTGYMP